MGEVKIDAGVTRDPPLYATTLFTCGDHYLLPSVGDMRDINGDVRTDLINLTQSALPWLCQGELIPGLGATIDERCPTNTIPPTTSTNLTTNLPGSPKD